jgi:hypothetical protein
VPVNSRHPNAAILIALYVSTPEGQALHWELDNLDLHYYPDSRQYRRMKEFEAKGYTFFPQTFENFDGFDSTALQKKYSEMLGNAVKK